MNIFISFVHEGQSLSDYVSGCWLYGSYLSSERVLVRPAGRWGPLRSLPPELKGASWEVRGCGELCWERERSGRGCCCSSDDDPHVGYCRWQPEAHLGSWGLSSRTHMGTGISCTLRGKSTHTQNNTSDHQRQIHMALLLASLLRELDYQINPAWLPQPVTLESKSKPL